LKEIITIWSLLLLAACSTSPQAQNKAAGKQAVTAGQAPEVADDAQEEHGQAFSRKVINRNIYTVKVLSATVFLERKGENIAPEDREGLAHEIVALLEIQAPDAKRDFFESPGLALSKEDGLQYLVGGIGSDITLVQGTKEFYPSGVSFERVPGMQHKIRVLLFFSGVDLTQKMKISYYDRLMGSGIINFGINN